MSVASFDEQFLLTSKEFAESKSYWLQQLAPLSSSEDVGLFNTWNITDNRDILLYKLDKTVAGKVWSLCKGQELSVYIYMVTACCVLINKYTGAQYITICAPLFDKQQHPHAPHQQQYLPLLCNISPEKTFKELLVSVGEVVLHAAGNQHYPLAGIYQELDIDEKRFDMMLSCDQLHGGHPKKKNESPFLIDLDIRDAEISFRVSCAVQTTFSIDGFITHLKTVITESLSHLSAPVATIPLLNAGERAFLLQERNDTFVDTGDDRTIADLFAESVARDAAATAVVCGGESMSYGELDKQSNRVARYLRKKGVVEDELVAVCLDRSLDMMVALLGIIKAGAAYVPVDPLYPASRIDYMLSDTKAKIVLSSHAYAGNFRTYSGVEVLEMNDAAAWLADCTDAPVETNLHPEHLAYVIYTSGSTGRPKGVMNEHRGVVNRLLWTQSYFGLTPADAVLQKTTYCFDVSVWELFWPLVAGCRLVFAAPGGQQDPYYLKQLIKSAQITTIHFVPSMLSVFCDSVEEGEVFPLRRVLCSGEALKPAHVKQFRDKLGDIGLHNLYGPTEAAIDVSCWTVPLLPALPEIVPIGKPVWNTSLYILDDQLNVLPAGASGELLIGGVQVARGYLNQPELSAAKFIDNPYAAGRLYHTGDLARWLPDGNIEYLGRRDDQVKVRGFRVELGEVERMLQQAPGIKQAVVLVNNDAAGSKILAGYIVTSGEFSKETVNAYLQNKLPEYMIPSVLFTVKEMPLTLNGKVDKKRLLKEQEVTVSEYVAPEHEFEKVLATIWEGLLNISRIGVHDKFFEIGGHSLLAMRVIAAVRKQLHKEISVRDIFDHPTIASLCQKMLTDDNRNEVIPPIQYYAGRDTAPLSFSQERIWFIDQLNGSREYHMPYVLKLDGEVNIPLFETAVRMIVERHGALRTVIRDHDGRAYQTLLPAEDWKLGVAQAGEVIAAYGTLDNYIDMLVDAPFDLANDMSFRLHLITVAPGSYILVVVLHHIASDGWSMGILVKETTAAYHSLLAGETPVFHPLPVRYIDYAIWQRAYLTKEVMAAKLEYWKGQLKDLPVMELPADYPRPVTQSVKGKGMNAMLGREVLVALQEVSGKEGATLFMILLAAFKVLLYRFSGQQDIVIGSPVANRQQQETEGMIGFFVNTLVLRNKINGNLSFKEFLREVTQSTLQAFEHQDVQLEKIVDELELPRDLSRNPLFQIMFALQNTPEGSKLDLPGVASHSEGSNVIRSKYDLSLDVVSFADGLDIALTYCSDLYREETMERLFSSYIRLLTSITENPGQRISSLCRLTAAESHLLLEAYNDTDETYAANETILDLFRTQVKNTPGQTAVLHGTATLSYQELEAASNQLAHYLLSKGIKEGMLVPVFVERGLDMLTAVLGILKAGAAYVPIDVKYPDERVAYILKDSNAAFVVCSGAVKERLTGSSLNIIDLQQSTAAISNCPVETPAVMLKSSSLAYIIYTSGSTGQPKGVMIEHGNVYHFIRWCLGEFSGDDFKMVYAVTSLCFDLSVFELFYSLSAGKTIRILDDALEIPTYLPADREVLINTVPGVIQGLVDSQVNLDHVTCINMAGEAIQSNLLAELDLRRMKVRNLYGPSEDTTYTTVFHLQTGEAPLIGQPISNTKIYIVNNDLELCVPGTPGELCISGAGLARGYLNDAALTARKFIANPFGPGRLYRTGDIARWLPDGNLAYLGRSDDQVKIRGYRIEPGEVETVLGNSPGVKQAVVVATTDTTAPRRLIGFIVKDTGYDKDGVQAYLSSHLPAYMMPSLLVELERIPLTTNGKVNRKQLAAYILPSSGVSANFVLPRNAVEKTLATIWEGLLGISGIGVYDNFFELGGDSIITIQVVSRARREGIIIQPKDIFVYQDIASLSAYLAHRGQVAAQEGEQGVLTGNSGVLPVQQWYLGNNGDNEHISHYNQQVLLRIAKSVSADTLHRVAGLLTARHDALGFRYSQTAAGEWEQSYSGSSDAFVVADLQHVDAALLSEAITHSSQQYQESLDITTGPVFRMVLLLTPAAEEYHRLLLVVHHLAVDGVSWRILLEDLDAMLTALQGGQAYEPLAKTSSYREWYQALSAHGFSSQLPYWERISAGYEPLRGEKERVRHGDMARHAVHFSAAQTKYLLQEVPRIYQTEVNDLLLYALCRSLTSWSGHARVHIGLEGHGREALPGTDLSRTVGWFTTMYPVMLETTHDNTRDNLLSIKEQLRQIPEKGIGYGVLKYIHGAAGLSGKDPWDLVFNYLGQSDNVIQKSDWLSGAAESGGQSINDGIYSNALIEVNSIISGGSLQMNWSYSRAHYSESEIAVLSTAYFACLDELIAHCTEQGNNNVTYAIPADYGLSGDVSYEELNGFLSGMEGGVARRTLLSGVYRLSPLQEGLLFHGLYDETGGAYIEQFRCEVGALDERAFIRSWEHLLSQHSILRSSFYAAAFNIPVQVVHQQCTLPLQQLDYRGRSEEEQQSLIAAYLQADREAGFDFQQAPLMRFALIRLAESRTEMIWTFHHLILDGWSTPLLMEEFLQTYEAILSRTAIPASAEDRYEDYIRYIADQNGARANAYWRNYLKDVTAGCLLPYVRQGADYNKGISNYKEETLLFDEAMTAQINSFCRSHHLTINTFIQGIWSFLLHFYTGSNKVAYGITVSGRPEDLPGMEKRVGMYTNTLPLYAAIIPDMPVLDWMYDLQHKQLDTRRYQYTSLSELQEIAGISGDLFDTMITFQNYPVSEVVKTKAWQLEVHSFSLKEQTGNYPLSLRILSGDKILIQFIYREEVMEGAAVKAITGHFEQVLQQLLSGAATQLNELRILTPAEETTIRAFNNNQVDFGPHTHILELIAAQVANNGSATAVVYEQQELSYETLWERSGQLANYLAALGVGREVPVAVLVDRGFNMLVSMLAILRAGGAYVPLEPAHPAERLRYMLEDTGAVIVLTDYAQSERLADVEGLRLVDIEDLEPLLSQYPATVPEKNISGTDLGYIIYTSGSTGRPKGVMIQHEGILNMVQSHIRILSLKPGLRILQFASYGFDGSCQEIFNTLCSGGTLIVASPAEILSASLLGALLERERVDIATLPPSYQILLKEQLGSLKVLYSAGEALHAEVAAYLQSQGVEVVNGYGPTENTVTVTLSRQPLRADGQVTIGAPIPNVSVYILDKAGRLCPVGVHGELYVGGVQVARGYVNNEAETAQKFIANPYGEGRLYRTGDTGCWLSDGTIAYKGRSDDQLKIRGYRIETGEVERVLQRAPGVEQGVVVAAGTVAAGQYLAAYLITGAGYTKEAVKTYLAQYLPEYMIPSAINVVDAFPLTSSSKINRKLLAQTAVGVSENNYAAATNQLEADLCRIWEELLEKEQISIDDDFFELGGHSLLGIRMISAIRKHLSLESDIREVFDYPTIRTLAAQLRSRNEGSLYPVISTRDSYGKLPLSYSQEQLWFVDRLQGSREYYMPYVYRLSGELDVAAFSEALHTIVYRHEILRTVIVEENGGVYQQVEAGADWSVTYETFDHEIPAAYISSLVNRPLDLSRDRMFNVWLLRESPTSHVLVALMHHIVFDGWSMSILINELSSLYVSRIRGTESGLLPLPVQYKDYALWQREHLTAAVMSGKINYWKEQLKGLTPLALPLDYPRPATQSIRGANITGQLNESVLNGLLALSQEEGTTLFMTLLSAFQVLLYRYTGQQDIYVGSPIAGRQHHELESLIGFFVNTLVFRIEVRGGETYTSLLSRVKEMMLLAYANQEVPFEKVVEVTGQRRDLSRHPLFDVKFQLENMPSSGELDLGGLSMQGYDGLGGNAQMDLSLDVRQSAGGLQLSFTYCTDLFEAATIEKMLQHYEYLLLDILKDRQQVVDQLQLLSPVEKDHLLFGFNDTVVDTGNEHTISGLFAASVALNPAATAVVCGDESLSYGELDKQSNRVAQYLRKNGVVEEELVAVCLDRSVDMIVSLLGILKAGAAYVPVDPLYPSSRIDYILGDTNAKIVLSSRAYAHNFRTHKGVEVLDMNDTASWLSDSPDAPVTTNLRPDHLAYVIYTSGSTGRPKGVMNEHRGVVNRLLWTQAYFGLTPEDAVLQKTTYCFDVSVWELFWPLIAGSRLVFAAPGGQQDPYYLKQLIKTAQITTIHFVPSMLGVFCDSVDAGEVFPLRRVLCSGEALKPAHVKQFRDKLGDTGLHNLYGPTEAAIDVSCWTAPAALPEVVPIGKPVWNTSLYILDDQLNVLPAGASGELFIGGIQVARGYLNQPELTAAKFINNPYGAGRLYRSGDQARWLPDGNIEYLGRRDDQVKVRGYRIEPGEVEAAINELPEVLTSAVVVKRDVADDNKLVCYYVPSGEAVREKERGLYEKHVSGWQELYEAEYSEEDNNGPADETFDIRGWNDSFTGNPISAADMKAWLDDIIAVTASGNPRRVLELGCGTGLLYYRLRNTIAHYTGSDISATSVNALRRRLATGNGGYCETELYVKPAHEALPVTDIDTLILNSIVQYFPSAAYLTTVIGTHLPRVAAGGRIIIGDVRDYRLLKLFHSRKALLSLQDSAGLEEFDWFVSQGVEREEELCLSPEYFYGLKDLYPRITHVEIFWKNGDFHNELSLYRYTVVLHTDEVPVLSMPSWQPWNASPDADTLLAEIASAGTLTGLLDVPNPRLYVERHLQSALSNRSITAVADLSGISTMSEEEQQVLALLSAATARGYYCQLQLQADALRMNVVLCRENIPYTCGQYYHATPTGDAATKANSPLFMESSLALQKDIRIALEARLPEYMIPTELMPLQHMPLTLNGKTDRKFLTSRNDVKVTGKIHFEAPLGYVEETLAEIWKELLMVSKIGRHDDFFEAGGHSLLATRVVSAIRKKMNKEVSVRSLFLYPTIALLAEFLSKENNTGTVLPEIKVRDYSQPVPLSFSQERVWFIDKLKGSLEYHMPWVYKIQGKIDTASLEAAFRDILIRHEVLRTVIHEEDGKGYQVVKSAEDWQMHCLSVEEVLAVNLTIETYIHAVLSSPFDLSADFMLRVHVITTAADEHLLVATTHHIAFDGWSLSLMVEELTECYRSRIENRPAQLKALPVQYADYAAWQRAYMTEEVLAAKVAYWKEQLQDLQPLTLLTDFPRPAEQQTRGGVVNYQLDKKIKDGLVSLSNRENATLFMTLLAAFKVLLYRYTGQSSIHLGTPVAGRQQQETEGMIGFFVNMLVLRSQVQPTDTFIELLQAVKSTTLDAYEKQDVPFEQVVEVLGVRRDMSRYPLFDISFQLLNMPKPGVLGLEGAVFGNGVAAETAVNTQFDLGVYITELNDGLNIQIVYASSLYKRATVERMLRHYEQLLISVLAKPAMRIGVLPVLPPAEEKAILTTFNAEPWKDGHHTIVSLFDQQVSRTPSATAIRFEGAAMSYGQLQARANQLARYLASQGVGSGTLVGLCMDKCPEMMISILAILKAGAAYVPVDPAYPSGRIHYMINDMGNGLVLTQSHYRHLLAESEASLVYLDEIREEINTCDTAPLPVVTSPDSLAYMMYTSGSSGKPKGVEVLHRSVVNLAYQPAFVTAGNEDVLLSTCSVSFDPVVFEYFAMLFHGGQLVFCASPVLLDVSLLKAAIRAAGVTMMWFTTGWFNELVEADPHLFEGMQQIVVGGDRLSVYHVGLLQRKYPALQIVNGYGPTENSTFSTAHRIRQEDWSDRGDIPIGRPLPGRESYVLDAQQQLCGIGVAGELYVGGVGIARGYHNAPALTAAKFVANPFGEGRLYRTGDQVKWLPEGLLAYLGRVDEQVKIRGFRVEPGEVEWTLQQAIGVKHAVVLLDGVSAADKQLVAYVEGENLTAAGLQSYLQQVLPAYMIPSRILVLDNIPLTENGKVNRSFLRTLSLPAIPDRDYVAPRTPAEEQVAGIWQSLLRMERIGIYENFFECGGHSLLVMRVLSAIRKKMDVEISVKDFFQMATIESLARYISLQQRNGITLSADNETVRL